MKRYLWGVLAVLLAAGMSFSTVAAYSKYQERNRISEQYGYMENELAALNRKIEMAEVERTDSSAAGDSQLQIVQQQIEDLNRELAEEEELLAAAQSTLDELSAAITQTDLENMRRAQEEELAREREARRQAEEEAQRSSEAAASRSAAAQSSSQAQSSSSRASGSSNASTSSRASAASRASSSSAASGAAASASADNSSSSRITVRRTSSSSASVASTAPGAE